MDFEGELDHCFYHKIRVMVNKTRRLDHNVRNIRQDIWDATQNWDDWKLGKYNKRFLEVLEHGHHKN